MIHATLFGMHTKLQEDQENSLLSTAKQNVLKIFCPGNISKIFRIKNPTKKLILSLCFLVSMHFTRL